MFRTPIDYSIPFEAREWLREKSRRVSEMSPAELFNAMRQHTIKDTLALNLEKIAWKAQAARAEYEIARAEAAFRMGDKDTAIQALAMALYNYLWSSHRRLGGGPVVDMDTAITYAEKVVANRAK